ncbi:hypothetical protein [Actinomadura sp. NEAU-AAG7]|nr:hypothetical protein [Actinomadura sp. NEAU-AAG7]MBT2212098.1 hypothetical protein [Actinomadura sp. NEAU-AAG7]
MTDERQVLAVLDEVHAEAAAAAPPGAHLPARERDGARRVESFHNRAA